MVHGLHPEAVRSLRRHGGPDPRARDGAGRLHHRPRPRRRHQRGDRGARRRQRRPLPGTSDQGRRRAAVDHRRPCRSDDRPSARARCRDGRSAYELVGLYRRRRMPEGRAQAGGCRRRLDQDHGDGRRSRPRHARPRAAFHRRGNEGDLRHGPLHGSQGRGPRPRSSRH